MRKWSLVALLAASVGCAHDPYRWPDRWPEACAARASATERLELDFYDGLDSVLEGLAHHCPRR